MQLILFAARNVAIYWLIALEKAAAEGIFFKDEKSPRRGVE
ncbi:MAG: hypothetical protein ACRC24_06700 [Vibrionaceae bacterium]